MYDYLKGEITAHASNQVTIEVGQIGYLIDTPNPYEFAKGDHTTIYVHHYVREDSESLYGFKTKDQRRLFIKLLSVKGIGPKSAMAILATGNVNDLIGAIELGNDKFLRKFPGIGPKSSQQIILDLKGKINLKEDSFVQPTNLTEVEEALDSLGYKKREIKKALKHLDPSKPTNQLLKDALAEIVK
ncbi:MAG: Holliday junction branch migration protein RuvA [Candidatus Izimaplasma sp.]|nr:Holliday junction branch migration protein RuvA [Candidatus Izimaplasma bacterium]